MRSKGFHNLFWSSRFTFTVIFLIRLPWSQFSPVNIISSNLIYLGQLFDFINIVNRRTFLYIKMVLLMTDVIVIKGIFRRPVNRT